MGAPLAIHRRAAQMTRKRWPRQFVCHCCQQSPHTNTVGAQGEGSLAAQPTPKSNADEDEDEELAEAIRLSMICGPLRSGANLDDKDLAEDLDDDLVEAI